MDATVSVTLRYTKKQLPVISFILIEENERKKNKFVADNVNRRKIKCLGETITMRATKDLKVQHSNERIIIDIKIRRRFSGI